MKKLYYSVFAALLMLLFCGCGIKSYRAFEMETNKIEIFNSSDLQCEYTQSIADDGNGTLFIDFIPHTDIVVKIDSVTAKFRWKRNGIIETCPFYVTSFCTEIFRPGKPIIDNTFKRNEPITESFKKVTGNDNSLQYVLSFNDSTTSHIPTDVDALLIDIDIKVISEGNTIHYKETIESKAKKHRRFWFLRDR